TEMTRSLEPTGCEAFRQHLKSCSGHSPCANSPWHGFDVSDNPEMYMEERLKCHQARLARSLRKVNEVRLLRGYNPRTGYASEKKVGAEEDASKIKRESVEKGCSSRKGGAAAQEPPVLEQLIMEKENKVIKLRDVELILPKVAAGAKGILETHVNGFLFTSYDSSFHVHCLFKDIKASFFQLANGCSPPLLHFHMNWKKTTKDILVHLLTTPGSDKVEKEKHKRYEDRNRELNKFIFNVEDKWICTEAFADLGPIQELMEEEMFYGYLSSEEEAVFTLTFFAIHVRVLKPSASPFVVVDQDDIEIVNLVVLGNDMIDMTVIPKDFKVESMFEIRFPSRSLAAVKDWLYRGHIKYYVNKAENWKDRVKDIAENFQTFLEGGGWAQYELEDDATVQDYYGSESESEASDEQWGDGCRESDSNSCSESD
ncbi:hypothetical protein MKW92_018511, partial [Papaver armeniacum]